MKKQANIRVHALGKPVLAQSRGMWQKARLARWAQPCVRAGRFSLCSVWAPCSEAVRCLLNWLVRGKQNHMGGLGFARVCVRASQMWLERLRFKRRTCTFQKPVSVSTGQCNDFLLSTSIRGKRKSPSKVECRVRQGCGPCPRLESLAKWPVVTSCASS